MSSRLFQTKIVHHELTLSPFSSEQMADIGTVVLRSITDRIREAKDVTDSPAKPLVERYARRKIQRGRAPVRDWLWRGLTLGSLKVKRASQDMVTIGPVNTQAEMIVATQNARQKQWGFSPKDNEAMRAVVLATLRQPRVVYWRKTGAA